MNIYRLLIPKRIDPDTLSPEERQKYEERLRKEGGFMMVESMGSLLFYLLMLAGTAVLLTSLFSGSNLSDTEQSLSTLRMQIKQLYTSSPDYTGLTTTVARSAGVVPEKMVKSNGVRNVWNGTVNVAAGTDPNTFVITFSAIPEDACTKLATFQSGSWVNVSVNGTAVNQTSGTVAAAATLCTTTNTIAFTSN